MSVTQKAIKLRLRLGEKPNQVDLRLTKVLHNKTFHQMIVLHSKLSQFSAGSVSQYFIKLKDFGLMLIFQI